MEHMILSTICFLLVEGIFSPGFAADVTSPPAPHLVALRGEHVDIACGVDVEGGPFYFAELITRPGTESKLFCDPDCQVEPRPQKYAVTGRYVLRVKDVQLQDGGEYACKTWTSEKYTTNLIVVDQPSILVPDLFETDIVNISCLAQYGGSKWDQIAESNKPQLRLRVDGKELPGTPYLEKGDKSIKLTMTYNVNSAHHDTKLECELLTENPAFSRVTEQQLDIKFPVRNIQITPNDADTLNVGDALNCTAEGNPSPRYQWQVLSQLPNLGPALVRHARLQVRQYMAGALNEWRCTASNTVRVLKSLKQTVKFQAVEAHAPTQSAMSNGNPVTNNLVLVILATITVVAYIDL